MLSFMSIPFFLKEQKTILTKLHCFGESGGGGGCGGGGGVCRTKMG